MSDIISKASKYFDQLRETEGDELYIDKSLIKHAPPAAPVENASNTVQDIEQSVSEPAGEKLRNWQSASNLDELNELIHDCIECPLGETRNKFVFGEGNPNAEIFVIGEGPGADEDAQGRPFIGRAGQLLTKILKAIEFEREDVFIGNIVKCRPPNNRRPEAAEVEKCEQYLHKQIELIDPQFILALGLTAVDTLLKSKHKMADIRGNFMDYRGRRMMVTYHPAALLRNPALKKPVWEDVQKLRAAYDEYMKSK